MEKCHFCNRLADRTESEDCLIYEDNLVYVAHEIDAGRQTYLGTVLIQTKRHTENGLASLTDEEGQLIGLIVAQLSRGLRELLGAPWTYTYCFTEGFRHFHQFVVARHAATPTEYVRLRITEWREAPRGSRVEVVELSRKLGERIRIPRNVEPKPGSD